MEPNFMEPAAEEVDVMGSYGSTPKDVTAPSLLPAAAQASSSTSGAKRIITPAAKARAFFLLNIVNMLFGTNHVLLKLVSDEGTSASVQMFLRFGIAAVALSPWSLFDEWVWSQWRSSALLGAIMFAAYVAQIIGIGFTSSVHSAVISTCCVLAVPVLAGCEGKRVPSFVWPGAVMAFVGVLVLTHSERDETGILLDDVLEVDGENVRDTTEEDVNDAGAGVSALQTSAGQALGLNAFQSVILGDTLCFAAAALLGYHTLRSADVAAKYPDRELHITAAQMAVVASLGLLWLSLDSMTTFRSLLFPSPSAVLDEEQNKEPRSLEERLTGVLPDIVALPWGALAFTGLVSTALVLYLSVDPSVASIVYAGEPVWGVLFAVVFMGDRLNAWGWCGAALVMVSGLATQAWDHARERGQGASDKGWRTAAAGEGLLPRKRPRPNRRPSAKALRPAAKTSGGVCYSSSAVNESLTAEEELLV